MSVRVCDLGETETCFVPLPAIGQTTRSEIGALLADARLQRELRARERACEADDDACVAVITSFRRDEPGARDSLCRLAGLTECPVAADLERVVVERCDADRHALACALGAMFALQPAGTLSDPMEAYRLARRACELGRKTSCPEPAPTAELPESDAEGDAEGSTTAAETAAGDF